MATAGQRVLVLGGGGREHALAWALSRSPSVREVLVAPGNPGCDQPPGPGRAAIRPVPVASLAPGPVVARARAEDVGLVVVGPEAPLCAGVVDALDEAGIAAFGPRAAAARLEGSKAFLKQFAARHDIPTAPFLVTSDIDEAERYVAARGCPVVVKADGLAAGKGAVVTRDAAHARTIARAMLVDGVLGEAGRTIVIEDRLDGCELSVHALCDGERLMVLPVSRDHKRLGDGDQGPNTGGMGAFAPVAVDPGLMERIERQVLRPTIDGMRAEGAPYRGVLYAGLMIAPDGTPYLLEHNVRFGDPETQVLVPLLAGDVAALLTSVARGALDPKAIAIAAERHAIVVVLAAAGYPDAPRKGDRIEGVAEAAALAGVCVFHSGTAGRDGELVTAGGRVLGVTAVGRDAREARARVYRAVDLIGFSGRQHRRDIAATALG